MTPDLHFPWLELSIFIPLVAAIVCFFSSDQAKAQRVAFIASVVTLVLAIGEWLDFWTLESFSAHDRGSLFLRLFGREPFVVDELSAPLLPMAALLFTLTIAVTMRSKVSRVSFGLTMLAEAIILATLSCKEPVVLVGLLVLGLIPPWLELRARGESTRMFTAYLTLHIGLLAAGLGVLAFGGGGAVSTNVAGALLLGSSLIRAGVFPAHSWIVDLFERATFGTALLFVVPMTGAYVVMRLVLPNVPVWALHGVAVLSLLTAVYAAALALVQNDGRRFFAFLLISHTSLVLAGLELANPVGMTGALCIWLANGVSLAGFALILRAVESRIGRIGLDQYHGLFDHMPYLGGIFLLTGLASIGFPGSLAFFGMELLVEGTVEIYPMVGMIVVLAAALNGVAVLRAYFRIFTGKRHVATIPLTARPAERIALVSLSLIVLGAGLWPGAAVASRHHAAEALLKLRKQTGVDAGQGDETPHPSALDQLLEIKPGGETEAGHDSAPKQHDADRVPSGKTDQ